MWVKWFDVISQNRDYRLYGHCNFAKHYSTYLYFRVDSKEGSKFNPARSMTTCLWQHDAKKKAKAAKFFKYVLGMTDEQAQVSIRVGDAQLFKRACNVAQYRRRGGSKKTKKVANIQYLCHFLLLLNGMDICLISISTKKTASQFLLSVQ